MMDFFEMERVIEELAKAYPAQCATTWFKITNNYKPSKEEYREKVVEYMKIFEYLTATYPPGTETEKLKDLVKKSLEREIERIIKGENNEVEKRHKYYVNNSPSLDPIDTLKKTSEQQLPEKSFTAVSLKKRKRHDKVEEKEPQEILYENNEIINTRKRKKKSILLFD